MTALSDKVAIVTGASSGIGYATAKLFAREDASRNWTRSLKTSRRRVVMPSRWPAMSKTKLSRRPWRTGLRIWLNAQQKFSTFKETARKYEP